MPPTTVLLSLGSNLEPRIERIRDAIDAIGREVLEDVVVSSMYETEPVGYTDQPAFINAAAVGKTTLSAEEVHRRVKDLEQRLGRQHRQRWREREIDIDVILCGDVVADTDVLTIPHPRMQERRFVLVPCAEIAPDLVHPVFHTTVRGLLEACPDTSAVKVVDSLSDHPSDAHP